MKREEIVRALKKERKEFKSALRVCPSNDCTCPYYDMNYRMCTLLLTEGVEPKDECDDYFGIE